MGVRWNGGLHALDVRNKRKKRMGSSANRAWLRLIRFFRTPAEDVDGQIS